MPGIHDIAVELADMLYENEATVLHRCLSKEVTAKKLCMWADSTINMIKNDACCVFALQDIQSLKLYVHEVAAVISSW